MIATYSEYIDKFMALPASEKRPIPGEHHFVSAYLIPRIYEIRGSVPEYINPDGTKAIVGDVVYYDNGKHQHGIEVKLGTIRLTSGEYNKWIVSRKSSGWPETFIGIGGNGIGICSWAQFRAAYIGLVREREGAKWNPVEITKAKQYGPIRQVDKLLPILPEESHFLREEVAQLAAESEAKFIQVLRGAIDC